MQSLAVSRRWSTLDAATTLEQAQDDYLKEIQDYTAMFKSVDLPKQ